jgi:hypothetical protein
VMIIELTEIATVNKIGPQQRHVIRITHHKFDYYFILLQSKLTNLKSLTQGTFISTNLCHNSYNFLKAF